MRLSENWDMHKDLYPDDFQAVFSDVDAFLSAINTEQNTTQFPADPRDYLAAYELCSEYVGFNLVSARITAVYNVSAVGNYRLNPIRNYKIITDTSDPSTAVELAGTVFLAMPDGIIVDDISTQTLTLIYSDIVPQIIANAINRQAQVFHGRKKERPPESGGLDIDFLKEAQNSQFLGGLTNDVRSMLSPYRQLSF